jgi:nitrite reductase/ring-hydroxylating ferredoxin subunit
MPISGTGLHPFPNGWYAYGFAEELKPGRLLSRPFMGQDLIVYRTDSGKVCATDAYCPHLGAHFGFGGRVEGENLRCPFHGFQYDTQGVCVSTGYGTRPPPKARVRMWPVREQNGLLLIYHDADGRVPAWEVPALETQYWTPLLYRKFILFDHPQETTENSVDLGHFAFVHRYRNPRMLREAQIRGPYMSTAYCVSRNLLGLERILPNTLFDFAFDTHIYGLGYSQVDVYIPQLEANIRLWVLPTPIDEDRITLHLAASVKAIEPAKIHLLLAILPGTLLTYLVRRLTFTGFINDVEQDIPIWENKKYLSPPALAEGDGPIGMYRQWAKQFYSG